MTVYHENQTKQMYSVGKTQSRWLIKLAVHMASNTFQGVKMLLANNHTSLSYSDTFRDTKLTFVKLVTNHCEPPVLSRLSSECVASILTHPLCWMPAHTETSCSLIGCREIMLKVTSETRDYCSSTSTRISANSMEQRPEEAKNRLANQKKKNCVL